jgi:hypothetical protein
LMAAPRHAVKRARLPHQANAAGLTDRHRLEHF